MTNPTSALSPQNAFSTTLINPVTSTDTTIYLNSLPTASEGYLTIDEGLSTQEVLFFNSKGANFVTCPSLADRALQGTTTPSPVPTHLSGAVVKMKTVAQYHQALANGTGWSVGQVQAVSTLYTGVATGTTTIPWDDTIPQNTEGDQYMTQAITPKSATNNLTIRVKCEVALSAGSIMAIGALFQDSTANALAACSNFVGAIGAPVQLVLTHTMVAGTTSATTFKFRVGAQSAATVTFNGIAGTTRKFGGITISSIDIVETKP